MLRELLEMCRKPGWMVAVSFVELTWERVPRAGWC
jgi:hypothetical protein